MRHASICVGIVEYVADYYRDSNMRLRFAASDAIAFNRYLEQGSAPQANAKHILITQGKATSAGVTAAFDQLAGGERVDLLVVYLSGHGERGNDDGGWFCLADAEPGKCSLGAAQLDALLHGVDAVQTLVVIDCCHAETVFRHSRYFVQLGTSRTRLLIASARSDQRAWEVAALNRSVFSEVLLKGCSNQLHLQDSGGLIDVERTLFPFVREQVVLLAAANKNGSVQEPVTGGVSAIPLLMHSVSGSAFGRPISLADTLRARLRQILIGSACTLLIILMLVHVMTFHLVADSAGNIQVRTGLASTANLLPASLVDQVDTGYSVTHLDPRLPAFMSELARGEVHGIVSHADDLGLSAWTSLLVPYLTKSARASYDILVRGQPAELDATWSAAPFDEAQFLLSKNPAMLAEKLQRLYAAEPLDPPGCMSDPSGKIDERSLAPSPKVASQEIIWWAVRAGRRADDQLALFDNAIASTAYRSIHRKNSAGINYEATYLALAMQIVASQATNGTITQMHEHALSMLNTHCRLHAALVLGLIAPNGRSGPGAQGEAVLAQAISGYDRETQGDVANSYQELAVTGLMLLIQNRLLNETTLSIITTLLANDPGDIGGGDFAQRILLSLAEHQVLPTPILHLIDERSARAVKDPGSLEQLGIARVLSRNARFLPPARRMALKRLLTRMAATDKTMSCYHESLGFAGLAGPEPAISMAILGARLSPATLFAVPASTYRGETIILSTGDAAAVALGRLAQEIKLDSPMQVRLTRLAATRTDLPQRQALIAGLAYQRYGNEEMIADAIYRNLANASANARERALEVEVACTALVGRSKQAKDTISRDLLSQWSQESAAELRQALASTIGRARFPAIGELNLCGQLPDVVGD
jgi:hypothetical protein